MHRFLHRLGGCIHIISSIQKRAIFGLLVFLCFIRFFEHLERYPKCFFLALLRRQIFLYFIYLYLCVAALTLHR